MDLEPTQMYHGQKSRFVGDKFIPPLIGIPIMGPSKPLRTWVDDHPLLYGNNGSLDPSTNGAPCVDWKFRPCFGGVDLQK